MLGCVSPASYGNSYGYVPVACGAAFVTPSRSYHTPLLHAVISSRSVKNAPTAGVYRTLGHTIALSPACFPFGATCCCLSRREKQTAHVPSLAPQHYSRVHPLYNMRFFFYEPTAAEVVALYFHVVCPQIGDGLLNGLS